MRPAADLALGGRYRLMSRIAVGGMGEVWVGHDTALARDVAVKVLREEFAGDAGFLERFRTEARNSAQLSHPNIAQLYDYGEQEGSGFLVMELVLGEPMSDLLDRQPVLPMRRLLPILAQTARALHAAHVGGMVHRDVKPGNILLARSGRVKITDFGISTATNQIPMTATGMVMGTAQYLSPEQAIGRAATPASDVYALGIVAYEALVGNRPFTGPTAVDIAVAHVNTPVPPLPSDIDPELAALVMRMLAKEPEERPRSAASLARNLDAMLERTPPGGLPLTSGRHARVVDVMDVFDMPREDAPASSYPSPGAAPAAPTVVPGRSLEEAVGPTASDQAPDAAADRAAPAAPPPVYAPTTARTAVRDRDEAGAGATAGDGAGPGSGAGAAAGTAAGTGAGDGAGPQHSGSRSRQEARRTSTTTGRRWGQVSRPLVALVLMVVFALLGAAFADSLWGPARGAPAGDGDQIVTAASHGSHHRGGMIGPRPDEPGTTQDRTSTTQDRTSSTQHGTSTAQHEPAHTTTARDH